MIKRIELLDGYLVTVENDKENKKTQLGVEHNILFFTSKQEVVAFIALLNKALDFWEYESQVQGACGKDYRCSTAANCADTGEGNVSSQGR
jgi:hypothetical protein